MFFLALPLLVIAPIVSAAVIRETPLIQTFQNTNCADDNSCGLKEFKVTTTEFKVTSSKFTSMGTDLKMSYKTSKISELEDFAIVQFIKGCKFNSHKIADGSIQRYFGIVRDFFGEKVKFDHKEWVIDSIDTDPMYNNGVANKRHQYYRFIKNGKEAYYFQEQPTTPEFYVTDLPGTVSTLDDPRDIASNISLKFKSCIYKTSDIPLEVAPNELDFAKPIRCFEWGSSHIYNHKLNKYERKSEIDPFCG